MNAIIRLIILKFESVVSKDFGIEIKNIVDDYDLVNTKIRQCAVEHRWQFYNRGRILGILNKTWSTLFVVEMNDIKYLTICSLINNSTITFPYMNLVWSDNYPYDYINAARLVIGHNDYFKKLFNDTIMIITKHLVYCYFILNNIMISDLVNDVITKIVSLTIGYDYTTDTVF